MKLLFADRAWEDYLHWQSTDPNTASRINDLIDDCRRIPFRGLGKPEPLKGDLQGWWSRRINTADRLAYRCPEGRPPKRWKSPNVASTIEHEPRWRKRVPVLAAGLI